MPRNPVGLEKPRLRIGIIPLTDCAVIAVAKEQGFFARHGLDVEISREPSWASIRDKVMTGALDAAQMLGPMPIAATLGLGAAPLAMMTAMSLGLNGNAITVSNALYEEMIACDRAFRIAPRPRTASALAAAIRARRRLGEPPLTFATVYPFSAHNYALRYWLAEAGIHPDRDIRLIVVPPPQMMRELALGSIDGYCVGEPWNQAAVFSGVGQVVITGYELWNNAPEKILGVSCAWAQSYPCTHLALIRALIEAARWLDLPESRAAAAATVAADRYVGVNADLIQPPLLGRYRYSASEKDSLPDFNVFFRYAANFPWVSHGIWWLCQMYRWGQLTTPCDITAVARAVYRPDLYREAAAELDVSVPAVDLKCEGRHHAAWRCGEIAMGPDAFFDGRRFDPSQPAEYIAGFPIHSLRLPLPQLAGRMDPVN